MKTSKLRELVVEHASGQKLELLKNTSTVSWLYPGQFAYCLNEEFIWDRYGTFIDCPEQINFHKIQPVIRWNDFETHFLKSKKKPTFHLGLFDMTTINGGHLIPAELKNKYSQDIFKGLLDFLTNIIGLEKDKLLITYFPGQKLSELSKNKQGISKYDFDYEFPKDDISIKAFLNLGIENSQLKPEASRNCVLIPNWICGEIAPWGFRNEIYYKVGDDFLDIATIEVLDYRPIVKDGKIIGVEKWDKAFVINGAGIERIAMLKNENKSIYDIDTIKPLFEKIKESQIENPYLVCESIRIFQRLIADTGGNMRDARSKRTARDRQQKYNIIRRVLIKINDNELKNLFELNAELYPYYPELKNSIKKCLDSVLEYRKTQ